MIDKLLNLKHKNKILYYILIPLVVIAVIIKFLIELNVFGAKKDIKKAEQKDIDLKAEQEAAERKAEELRREAAEHKASAERHEKEADKEDAGLDWHLKE